MKRKVLKNLNAMLFVIASLFFALIGPGCGRNAGVIGISRGSYGNGINEVTELNGDGTYVQRITNKAGNTFTNTGTWETYREYAGPPGVPRDGSHIQLKGWMDVHSLPDVKAAPSAERVDFIVPGNMFSRPRN